MASKMPKPANIAFAGGNGCRSHQEQGTTMNAFRRTTTPIASLRAELIERAQDVNRRIERLHELSIVFPEFTKAPSLFLKNGGNRVDRFACFKLLGDGMIG